MKNVHHRRSSISRSVWSAVVWAGKLQTTTTTAKRRPRQRQLSAAAAERFTAVLHCEKPGACSTRKSARARSLAAQSVAKSSRIAGAQKMSPADILLALMRTYMQHVLRCAFAFVQASPQSHRATVSQRYIILYTQPNDAGVHARTD